MPTRPTKSPVRTTAPEPARAARKPDPATTGLALRLAQLLHEKQVEDLALLDVSGPLVISDYFLVGTVRNTRHALAIGRELDVEMKQVRGHRRLNTGGLESEQSSWVLLDFGDIVVHLFQAEARAYYNLEELWADAPRVPLELATPAAAVPAQAAPRARPKSIRILPPTDDSAN